MTRKKDLSRWLLILFHATLVLSGCSPFMETTHEHANRAWEQRAIAKNFQKSLIATDKFTLMSFQKIENLHRSIVIYIEGDGRTWITRTKLSDNPTPKNPLALKLAFLDPSANVAYLARPCQYTPFHLNKACSPVIWSDQRFSESIVHSMNQAIDVIKMNAKTKHIHLIGFSGGGAIAVLIAARRHDVLTLRTVAGDLDPDKLSQYHQTTPLKGSLNPTHVILKLTSLPAHHFSGENDPVVSSFIAEEFVNEMIRNGSYCARHTTLKNATHHKGWEAAWKDLLLKPVNCEANQS